MHAHTDKSTAQIYPSYRSLKQNLNSEDVTNFPTANIRWLAWK